MRVLLHSKLIYEHCIGILPPGKVNIIIKIGGGNFACVESLWKFNEVWGEGGHNWGEHFIVFFFMFQNINISF